MNAAFDPQEYANELQGAGVPREQAAIHARAWTAVCRQIDDKCGAICTGMTALGDRFAQLESGLKQLRGDFEIFKIEVRGEFEKLKTEMRAEFEKLRVDIASIRFELKLHRWALGALLAVSTSNLALTLRYVAG